MSWFKRNLGLDGIDLAIHAGVTVALMAMVDMSRGPDEMYPFLTIVSLVVLGVRRAVARRMEARRGLSTGEMAAERMADLELRMAELEAAHARVAELEDRLDFTERLLAAVQAEQPARLPRVGEH